MKITIKQKGNFNKLERFLNNITKRKYLNILDKYGQMGVDALSSATPVRTGLTARSWQYEIVRRKTTTSIVWTNSNIQNGVPIAIILQYGHGTRNGGYVSGRDYINPALRPVFDDLANQVWLEVTEG